MNDCFAMLYLKCDNDLSYLFDKEVSCVLPQFWTEIIKCQFWEAFMKKPDRKLHCILCIKIFVNEYFCALPTPASCHNAGRSALTIPLGQ